MSISVRKDDTLYGYFSIKYFENRVGFWNADKNDALWVRYVKDNLP